MERLHEVIFVESPKSVKLWEERQVKELAAENKATREKLRRIENTDREDLDSTDLIMKDMLDSRKKISE
ncbi:TPA: hypothetical protein QCY27_003635 [Bacillus pacificus]|nr:hypothetical protein [Bacillus pacificus]